MYYNAKVLKLYFAEN